MEGGISNRVIPVPIYREKESRATPSPSLGRGRGMGKANTEDVALFALSPLDKTQTAQMPHPVLSLAPSGRI
jgi:hypothetical protein